MTTGAGRFAVGSQFAIVNQFFKSTVLQAGVYTKQDLLQLFPDLNDFLGANIQQRNFADGKDDLAERVYIWGSTAFQLQDAGLRFHIEADGRKWIENYAVIPRDDGKADENFDLGPVDKPDSQIT
jgi:hypothetical protein